MGADHARQSELLARVRRIVALAHAATGPPQSADVVEKLLVQELRQSGPATVSQWPEQAGVRVGAELRRQDMTVRGRKKTRAWWCVFKRGC